jgi:phosphoadenosine phosphosulfate reductase
MSINNEVLKTLDALSDEILLSKASKMFTNCMFSTSFQAEDQVITDMIFKNSLPVTVFTLDTGRLPQETYETLQKTNDKYNTHLKTYFPDRLEVEKMVDTHGPNHFYNSVENRRECCNIRKVIPLTRALQGGNAWFTGLRKEQSVTRIEEKKISYNNQYNIIKINPILDWTLDMVWDYINSNDVPYNPLHDKGYPSIGCAPCTRAVREGEDIRAGRWWWEIPEHKECGLHNRVAHWNKK